MIGCHSAIIVIFVLHYQIIFKTITSLRLKRICDKNSKELFIFLKCLFTCSKKNSATVTRKYWKRNNKVACSPANSGMHLTALIFIFHLHYYKFKFRTQVASL